MSNLDQRVVKALNTKKKDLLRQVRQIEAVQAQFKTMRPRQTRKTKRRATK